MCNNIYLKLICGVFLTIQKAKEVKRRNEKTK